MHLRRPLVVALAAAALSAGAAAPASAAKKAPTPCPTTGTTLLKNKSYSPLKWRVYRSGTTLRLCTRTSGKSRRLKTLGTWSPATRVGDGYDEVAWTTRTTAADGTAADTIRTVVLATRKRRLTVTKAAVAPNATTPASTDTVTRLVADNLVIAWVTTGGRLAAAVRKPALVPAPDDGPAPFHAGSIYAVTDVGAADATALAAGVRVVDDSESDPCGGVLGRYLAYPAVGPFAAGQFRFFRETVEPGPGC